MLGVATTGEIRQRVELRRQHARAIFLSTRDDDQPRIPAGAAIARADIVEANIIEPTAGSDLTILLELPAMLEIPCIVGAHDCAEATGE